MTIGNETLGESPFGAQQEQVVSSSYTPPDNNLITFNFTATGYAAPASTAVNMNFGGAFVPPGGSGSARHVKPPRFMQGGRFGASYRYRN